MKLVLRSALLAGISALAVAGTALAGNLRDKVMTLDLPDGLVADIEYQGDVPPKVTVERPSSELAALWPRAAWTPFADMDRISADMDRQFDTMFRKVGRLDALPAHDTALMNWASAQALPASAAHFSYVATVNGRRFCARSVEITSDGPNQKPKVVSSTSGDCGASGGLPAGAKPTAPAHNT